MRFATAVSLLIGMLPISVFASGLEHVKQIIFGMDCAPCAYGVEQGLKGLSGVEQVTVSLNDGYAEVYLADGNRATLAEIRDVIRKSGFTAKDANVHVSGKVVRSNDGHFLLKTDSETFELNADDQNVLSQLAEQGSLVTVMGSVATGDGRQLSVAAIK